MNINTQKNNETVTIAVDGRLDTTTAPMLENEINDQASDAKMLVLNLNGLEYISSAGLRVLLASQKKMNQQGSMKITGVCEAVMEVFEMTGFADILTIE